MTKLAKIAYGLLIFGVTALAFAGLAYWESTLPPNCGNDGVCFSYDYGEMTKFRIILGTVFLVFGTMVKYADYEQRSQNANNGRLTALMQVHSGDRKNLIDHFGQEQASLESSIVFRC